MKAPTSAFFAACWLGIASLAMGDVTLTELENHTVRVEIDGRLFTEYRYEPGFFPILYPIIGPNGEAVTRHFPMKDGVPNEQSDHEHHRSLHFTHGDVNGYNFWAPQVKKNGHTTEIVHDRFEKIESGEKAGTLVVWTKWIGDDEVILRERKKLGFMRLGDGQAAIDYDVELHAPSNPVTLGDSDDAGMAVRVASTMKVRAHAKHPDSVGHGRIINSRGKVDDESWGQRAEWIDYHGPDASGKTVGIAVFDHPSNLRYPTGWHARYYGLLSASRWGITSFERAAGAAKGDGDYTIAPNGVLRLQHRYIFHHGDPSEAKIADRFASYAGQERFHPKGAELAEPRIIYKGAFIADLSIPGEQKKDWVQPSHPFCWQLSRDRWLWVFQTRAFEGIDTERGICYQIRRDRPDGPVIREQLLVPFRDDWDALGDGKLYWKTHGHPKVFGVPKGALGADGSVFAHHNHFVLAYYRKARAVIDGKVLDPHADPALENTQKLEWLQFRLNDADDDIGLLTEPTVLRQKGFETGEAICSLGSIGRLNHWAHAAEPLDDSLTRWLDTPHFYDGIAAIEYRFNPDTNLYEWVRTGVRQKSEPGKGKMFEGSINRVGDQWILCVRNRGHVLSGFRGSCTAWYRTDDPFAGFGKPIYAPIPSSYCPRVAHLMPDGVLRIFSGDFAASPHRQKRDPLFCWDVDPKTFAASNPRTILDGRQNLGMELPMIGFAKLSPVHNNRQILTFRVTTLNHRFETERYPAVTEHDLAQSGAHYCVIRYPKGVAKNTWRFNDPSREGSNR